MHLGLNMPELGRAGPDASGLAQSQMHLGGPGLDPTSNVCPIWLAWPIQRFSAFGPIDQFSQLAISPVRKLVYTRAAMSLRAYCHNWVQQ